jgi:hypothetical protein
MKFRGLGIDRAFGHRKNRQEVVVWSVLNELHADSVERTGTSPHLWCVMARQFDPELRRADL